MPSAVGTPRTSTTSADVYKVMRGSVRRMNIQSAELSNYIHHIHDHY